MSAASPFGEQRVERVAVRVRGLEQTTRVDVLEQELNGFLRVALVRADDPGGSALDPTDHVLAGERPGVAEYPPALVWDHTAAIVVGQVLERQTAIADRAEHEPASDFLEAIGRSRPDHPRLVPDELVMADRDPFHPVLAEDLDRRDEEAQHDPARLPGRLTTGITGEDLDVLLRRHARLVALDERLAEGVELDVARVDEHVRVG